MVDLGLGRGVRVLYLQYAVDVDYGGMFRKEDIPIKHSEL
jgi:hypothetical protein